MSKASPCPSPEAGKNHTDNPKGVIISGTGGYLSISPPETLVFLLQLQQVIIDLYSQNFVKTITPQDAWLMVNWGIRP